MIDVKKKKQVTQTVITANVAEDGKADRDHSKRCSQSNYQSGIPKQRTPDPKVISNYAYQVVKKASRHLSFKEMNLVAHSMGNMSVLYYLLEHGSDENLPKIIKQVAIANHVAEGMNRLPQGGL